MLLQTTKVAQKLPSSTIGTGLIGVEGREGGDIAQNARHIREIHVALSAKFEKLQLDKEQHNRENNGKWLNSTFVITFTRAFLEQTSSNHLLLD